MRRATKFRDRNGNPVMYHAHIDAYLRLLPTGDVSILPDDEIPGLMAADFMDVWSVAGLHLLGLRIYAESRAKVDPDHPLNH